MTARVWLGRAGWYWRGGSVNQCGPFPTCAAATADAFKVEYRNDNEKETA
jgi:hypothetical protein